MRFFLKVKKILQVILIFIFAGSNVIGQINEAAKYTTEDGLPHLIGYDMVQDREGFMWINTDAGVSRFDGNQFTSFILNDSLGEVYPITIGLRSNNSIWIGSHKRGVYTLENNELKKTNIPDITLRDPVIVSLDSGKFLVHEYYPPNKKSVCLVVCQEIHNQWNVEHFFLELKSDSVFVLTQHDGLYRYESDVGQYLTDVSFGRRPHVYAKSFQSSNGEIFFATSHGVYKLEKNLSINRVLASEIPAIPIEAINEDQEGNIWVVSENTLFVIGKEGILKESYKKVVQGKALQLEVADSENLYMLTSDRRSLFAYNLVEKSIQNLIDKIELSSSISFIKLDQEKNLWLTTTGEGIIFLDRNTLFQQVKEKKMKGLYITSFHEDAYGNLWIGTKNGLYRCEIQKDQRRHTQYPIAGWKENDEVVQVLSTQKGEMILNAADGIFMITPKQNKIDIAYGEIFIRQPNTIVYYVNNYIKRKKIQEASSTIIDSVLIPEEIILAGIQANISQIEEDNRGAIWIGTGIGLFQYYQGAWNKYDSGNGLPFNRVNTYLHTDDSQTWVGTEKGLGLLQNGKPISFPYQEKLSMINCRDLCLDKFGRLWIGTPKGIYCLGQNDLSFFNLYDGLPSDNITSLYIDKKNELWVGTVSGMASMNLNKPLPKVNPPKVYIDRVLVNGRSVLVNSHSEITPGSNLEIIYTAIDFRSSSKLLFRYRLNKERKWVTTDNRSLNLSDLRSGDYLFEVMAKKYNSDWSVPQKFPFNIQPKWWERLEIIFLFVLGIVSIVSWVIWWRVRQIKEKAQKQVENEKQMAWLKLSALQSQMNPHFMFNALNAIQHFIINKNQEIANEYLSKFSRLMRLYLNSTQETFIVLREEIELLQNYLELEQLRFEGKFDFLIDVDPKIPLDETEIPSMALQPFVENAVIHGLYHKDKSEKGLLRVTVKAYEDQLCCIVEDNGIGRERSAEIRKKRFGPAHKSKGQELIKARIQALNDYNKSNFRIEIEDLKGENDAALGTRVTIYFPDFRPGG